MERRGRAERLKCWLRNRAPSSMEELALGRRDGNMGGTEKAEEMEAGGEV